MTRIFRLLNKQVRETTASNILPENHLLKKKIIEELKRLAHEDKIKLPPYKKMHLLILLLFYQKLEPKLLQEVILFMVQKNGMIDDELKSFPDYNRILGTCRRNLTEE